MVMPPSREKAHVLSEKYKLVMFEGELENSKPVELSEQLAANFVRGRFVKTPVDRKRVVSYSWHSGSDEIHSNYQPPKIIGKIIYSEADLSDDYSDRILVWIDSEYRPLNLILADVYPKELKDEFGKVIRAQMNNSTNADMGRAKIEKSAKLGD